MQLKDTNLHYLLKQLGLTLNEADVYLYLLSRGTTFGAEIYSDLKMDKSSCYRALKNLSEKDLVYKVGEERNQQFSANPADHLEALVRAEEQRLKDTKSALNQFQTLFSTYVSDKKNKKVTVISNEAGHRQYMESRLRCKSKLIRDLSGRQTASIYYPDYDAYMTDYISRRVSSGIFLRQLNPCGDTDGKWERTSKEMLKEVIELPKDFEAPASFSVWDDTVSFSSKENGEQIGVTIHDPLIATLATSMFDFIWNTVK